MAVTVVLVCFLILYPLIILLLGSFKIEEWGKPPVYSLYNYIQAFSDPRLLEGLKNTLIVSVGTTVLASFFGVTLAWISARTNTPCRHAFEPLNLIPFFVSPFVGAISWRYLASPRIGLLNIFLMNTFNLSEGPLNIYSLAGIIWVMALFYTPYMYLFTIGSLKKMDPSLEESARICGSGVVQTTCRVILPLAAPGILSGVLITFVTSAGMFGVPVALGAPVQIHVLATQIYEVLQYPANYNLAAALGSLILLIAIIGVAVQRKILLPREFTTVTGKGFRPRIMDLGKGRYATLAFNMGFIFIAVVLPLIALMLVSFSKYWVGEFHFSNLTLQNFYYVLFTYPLTRVAIKNSLFLAVSGATLAVLFCTVIAYVLHRTRTRGRRELEFITTLPIGVPGLVLAMGFLLAYIKTPLYGTIWLMMIAYVTRFSPYALRTISAVLLSLEPELDESSRMCGGSWVTTMKNVTLPLLKPGIAAAWFMLFIVFIRELNTSILLWSHGNEVMSIALFIILEQKLPGFTAAFALIQTAMIFVLIVILRRVVGMKEITM